MGMYKPSHGKGLGEIKKTSIWLKKSEWEKIAYQSAESGKTVSAYIEDSLVRYIKDHPYMAPDRPERDKDEPGKTVCIAFSGEGYDVIKRYADDMMISVSILTVSILCR